MSLFLALKCLFLVYFFNILLHVVAGHLYRPFKRLQAPSECATYVSALPSQVSSMHARKHARMHLIGFSRWPETSSQFTSAPNRRPPMLSRCQAGRESILFRSGGGAVPARGGERRITVWMQEIHNMDCECAVSSQHQGCPGKILIWVIVATSS